MYVRPVTHAGDSEEMGKTYESRFVLPKGHPAGEVVGQDGGAQAESHSGDHERRDDAGEEPVVVAHCDEWGSGGAVREMRQQRRDPSTYGSRHGVCRTCTSVSLGSSENREALLTLALLPIS